MQSTNSVFMIRPAGFMFNRETAVSNSFQKETQENFEAIQRKVLIEFDAAVEKIRTAGVKVYVFDDTLEPQKPDAIFPNNWITLHSDGRVILYPMHAINRRYERRADLVEKLKLDFSIKEIIDLSYCESSNRFLEGTGSVIFDHQNRIAYACLSPRTDKNLFIQVCQLLNYKPIYFSSYDQGGKLIYHTNVMMCIGSRFAIICLESIIDKNERLLVQSALENSQHNVIDITLNQVNNFAGNMLQVLNDKGIELLILSQSAFNCLHPSQINQLEKYVQLVVINIPTIEKLGGGSTRCMIAEIFSPLVNSIF